MQTHQWDDDAATVPTARAAALQPSCARFAATNSKSKSTCAVPPNVSLCFRSIAILRRGQVVPRYFFHVYDGEDRVLQDTQGVELPNKLGVLEACRGIVEAVLSEDDFLDLTRGSKSFRITDESDRIVEEVPFH